MTRNRISELRAVSRTTRTGWDRAACRVRKVFATAIGPRLPVATGFTSCLIQLITTPFMRKVRGRSPSNQFAKRRNTAFASRASRRPAALSLPLEFTNDHEPTQAGRDLSGRQLRFQAHRADGEIFRNQSRPDVQ